jgi:hypothetical protein
MAGWADTGVCAQNCAQLDGLYLTPAGPAAIVNGCCTWAPGVTGAALSCGESILGPGQAFLGTFNFYVLICRSYLFGPEDVPVIGVRMSTVGAAPSSDYDDFGWYQPFHGSDCSRVFEFDVSHLYIPPSRFTYCDPSLVRLTLTPLDI